MPPGRTFKAIADSLLFLVAATRLGPSGAHSATGYKLIVSSSDSGDLGVALKLSHQMNLSLEMRDLTECQGRLLEFGRFPTPTKP